MTHSVVYLFLKASFEFMKKHEIKFDEHPLKLGRNVACGLPKDAGLKEDQGKMRMGQVNESARVLSEELLHLIDQKWKKVFTAATGYETYDAMRTDINEELGRSFT